MQRGNDEGLHPRRKRARGHAAWTCGARPRQSVALTLGDMHQRKRILTLVIASVAALALSTSAFQRGAPRNADHLLLMVFDQMRPDYIDRFGLENFKRLRSSSRNYPDAYVGHLTSQTVMAHVVIPTGLKPCAFPWVDEAMVDVDGAIGKPGLTYRTGRLTRAHYWQLLKGIARDQFLQAR